MGAPVPRLNVLDIAQSVGRGEASAVAVAREALERCDAYEAIQPQVWITRVEAARVMQAAARVDARVAAGESLPLAGVAFAVKDNLDVAGLPTTAGCPAFAHEPAETAPAVQRLIEAGAILLGKTNLDQFATGLVGARSPYGACGCVYNRAYVSGGSSSGSAVAVAAGLVGFALGTDTAGSGRVPAAFNNLVGLKPTRGRWSTRGLVPACRSLDCVSVFAGSAVEAAHIDAVIAGFDEHDPFARRAPPQVPPPLGARFRFGLPHPDQLTWSGDSQSPRLFEAAVARLESAGGEAVRFDLDPLDEAARLLYEGPWVAERTAAMEDLLLRAPQAIHPVVRAILQGGRPMTAVEAFRGQYRLAALARQAEGLWEAMDVILLPTAPTIFRIAEVMAEPFALNAQLGRYTNFVNLLDFSAIALPAGFRDDATGFGVTLMGPSWADRRLLDLARRYEEIAPMPQSPPLDVGALRQGVKLAVVGAHLAAMPLHWQLTSREARLVRRCRTSGEYRLYAMAGSVPPKPALVWTGEDGAAIEVEVYELDVEAFGSFVAEVPAPLAIGTLTLEDGETVKGFVAEPRALAGATDITHLGGWRAYIAQQGA